jgi:VWFA-related protein
MIIRKISFFVTALFAFAVFAAAQTPTPTPDDTEKVFTEEIKLNILAFDNSGKFASGVTKEDLVITEDGRIHQATSVRRVPANVLIVLDVGNEIAFGKNKKMTSEAAVALVKSLQTEDSVAVMQYADKVEFISEWTTDKIALVPLLHERKLGQGVRSAFNLALDTAVKFFNKSALNNRHLVLITDGIDSSNDQKLREAWTRNLFASDINVHVISYTTMAQTAINVSNSIFKGGEANPKRVPDEVLMTMPQQQQQILTLPRLGSVNTDREMIKKRKEQTENLKKSEQNLTKIAEDTNGEIFLPQTREELIEKMSQVARIVDASYVVTYVPKRALSDVSADEERNIEVTSKRNGLQIQAKRKLFVAAKK